MSSQHSKHNGGRSPSRGPTATQVSNRSRSQVRETPDTLQSNLYKNLEQFKLQQEVGERYEMFEKNDSVSLDSRLLRSQQIKTYGRPQDNSRPDGFRETRSAVDWSSDKFYNDRQKKRHSTKYTVYDLPEAQNCNTRESELRSKEESRGQSKGASFNIELGRHNLLGGIQLKKSKLTKRISLNESTTSGSKYVKDDPLAYGSFDEEHLAYPHPPSSKNYVSIVRQETSHQKSSSIPYGSPSALATTSILTTPNLRHNTSTGLVDLSQPMQSLEVNTGYRNGIGERSSVKMAPESPLLESYRGTYQSISPMPSPLLNAINYLPASKVEVSNQHSSEKDYSNSTNRKKYLHVARFHDPKEEAKVLAKALRGEECSPDTGPLISILPGLTHNQVLELRTEYKQLVKTGVDKKGVNIAKHIKMRLKDQPSFMKACYACALGQWESEAYWANYWYQSQKSRKELLIESLMGRTNDEIRLIKKGFRDKKYHNSLTRCLQTELREDKFKKAILLALEERRMEERPDGWLDKDLIATDVQELRNAVSNLREGESAAIKIVLLRSETHLRELLRVYSLDYGGNFAKEMLKKSRNLIGELLAHVLNGVINAPVRDALLLHHALTLPRTDILWSELLISRLLRYHWDRPHFERVRSEFYHRYKIELQTAVTENVSGNLGLFLKGLCVRRTEGDVLTLPNP